MQTLRNCSSLWIKEKLLSKIKRKDLNKTIKSEILRSKPNRCQSSPEEKLTFRETEREYWESELQRKKLTLKNY